MHTIKIFIASSSELVDDREDFRKFISQQNDRLHKQDIYLQVVQWENFLDAISNTRLQDEYNKAISDCDIVVCLFFTKVGKYTAEEFDTAYQVFKDTGKPKIWTYFKNANIQTGSITDEINTLLAFKKKIKDLGHFHTEYTGIDNLLNQYRNQLDEFLQPIADTLHVRASETSDNVNEIKNHLIKLESQIEILTSKTDNTPQQEGVTTINTELVNLKKERDFLKEQLAQRDEIIESQKQSKEELEKLLGAEKEKDSLKEEALEAVEQKDYNKADELLQAAAKERIEKVADDFYQIGIVKELKMEFAEALKYFKLAAAIPPHKPAYLIKAAHLSRTFGYLNQCIDYLAEAIEIEINNTTEDSSDLAAYYNDLGLVWQDKGDLDKAIEYLEKALNIYLKLFGEESLVIAIPYNNLGTAWHAKGDLDKAIEYFEKALNIGLKLSGQESPSVAIRYNNLGMVWKKKGDLDKALEYYEKALKIDLKLLGKENPDVAIRYNNLGMVWRDKGDLDKAIVYLEKSLNIDLKLFGEENPAVARDYNNLGLAWDDKGDLDKAIGYLEKAYTIFAKLYGEDNPSTKTVKQNYDDCLNDKKSA